MRKYATRFLDRVMWSLACVMALALIDGHAAGQCALDKLLASDGVAGDGFGWSVSISGNLAVVGSIGGDGLVPDTGAAYIYRLVGTTWVEEQKLLASDGAAYDRFGWSVSISDTPGNEVAIVTAPSRSPTGAAYVYRFNAVTMLWDEVDILTASDGLGSSVSVSGEVAIVGSRGGDGLVPNSGAAYIYRFNGTNWVFEDKVFALDGAANETFGNSVSISGTPGNEVAIVGADHENEIGPISGAAYIYRKNPIMPGWSEEQKLLASDGAAADFFGFSVSITGTAGNEVAVVGSINDDDNGPQSGSAYIFRKDPILPGWSEEQKLLVSGGVEGLLSGWSVSITGDSGNEVAIVGTYPDDEILIDPGAAYIFRRSGGSWVEESKLLAPDGAAFDAFGKSVSISGAPGNEIAIVAAEHDDNNGTFSGSAYILTDLFNPVLFGDCNANGIVDCQDITAGTSSDSNVNGLPDECEASIDTGTTALINPSGGTGAPADVPLFDVTNVTGGAGETVTVSISDDDLHPGTSGFSVVGSSATVNTSMADGTFFMTITLPFNAADLAGADWTLVKLLYFNTSTGLWDLAVASNTANSPGHLGPVGDLFVVSDVVDLTLAGLSPDLGDYGVFWNPSTLQGFAWANVDHTTDYTAGIVLCLADFTGPGNVPDGQVNVTDLLALLGAWGPNPGNPADFTGPGDVPDGQVNVTDLLALLGAWGACP